MFRKEKVCDEREKKTVWGYNLVVSRKEYFIKRKVCPVCGSKVAKTLVKVRYDSPQVREFLEEYYVGRVELGYLKVAEYCLKKCFECGLVWQVGVPGKILSKKLYSDWVDSEESLDKKRDSDLKFFLSYVRQVSIMHGWVGKSVYKTKVLDFGMGWGFWCRVAGALGFEVEGFEVSKMRVEFAKELGVRVISRLPRGIGVYDVINLEQVLEHVDNPLETMRMLSRLLKPGGVVHVAVPNGKGIEDKVKKLGWKASKDAAHPLEHLNVFVPETLEDVCKRVGLEPIGSVEYLFRQNWGRRHGVPNTLLEGLSLWMQQRGTDRYFYKVG